VRSPYPAHRLNGVALLARVPDVPVLLGRVLVDGGGAPGRFLINGKVVTEARKIVMQPNDEVTLETPGGGGYGLPGKID